MKLGLTKCCYQKAYSDPRNNMPHRVPCQGIEEQVNARSGKEEDHCSDDIDDIVELWISYRTHNHKGKVDPYDDGLVGPTIVIVFAVCV